MKFKESFEQCLLLSEGRGKENCGEK